MDSGDPYLVGMDSTPSFLKAALLEPDELIATA